MENELGLKPIYTLHLQLIISYDMAGSFWVQEGLSEILQQKYKNLGPQSQEQYSIVCEITYHTRRLKIRKQHAVKTITEILLYTLRYIRKEKLWNNLTLHFYPFNWQPDVVFDLYLITINSYNLEPFSKKCIWLRLQLTVYSLKL